MSTDHSVDRSPNGDTFRFDFTEDEMFRALRLVLPEPEAHRQAAAFVQAYEQGMNWGTSEQMLLYLAVGSESGRERVERIRRNIQAAHPVQDAVPGWETLASGEGEWAARVAELRRKLETEGKLPYQG